MGSNGYRVLVFGTEITIRRSVLENALALAESGGTVLFFGRLPSSSTEAGRSDPEVARLLEKLLGASPAGSLNEGKGAMGGLSALAESLSDKGGQAAHGTQNGFQQAAEEDTTQTTIGKTAGSGLASTTRRGRPSGCSVPWAPSRGARDRWRTSAR